MRIGIVIPAYNEENRIGGTLKRFIGFLNKRSNLGEFSYKILVVVNNTNDNTVGVIEKISKKNKGVEYIELKKGGKGNAIIEGFKIMLKSKYDLIGFLDADGSTGPEAFGKLIDNIGNYDGIIASRYIDGAKIQTKQPIERRIVSRVGNFIIRSLFLFNYRDTQCGGKLFRREALIKTLPSLTMAEWGFDIDLLYQLKKNNFRVKECAIEWEDDANSKLNIKKASPQVFFAAMRLRIINSPLKRLVYELRGPIRIILRILK